MSKKVIFISVFFISFLASIKITFANCLEGWKYRKTITLSNISTDAVFDYQYKIVLDTKALIDSGKLKSDGSDLRIVDQNQVELPFWIDMNNINTDTTNIWIRVNNIIPNASADFYIYYGNVNATSKSSGENTFLHFDNFDLSNLDFNNWTYCGGANGGTIPQITSGTLTLSSTTSYNHLIKSTTQFSFPVITNLKVNSISGGNVMISQLASTNNGYGEYYNALSSANFSLGTNITSLKCIDVLSQNPSTATSADISTGIWEFSWFKKDSLYFKWPSGCLYYQNDYTDTAFFSQPKNVVLSCLNNNASVDIDYIFTRKYISTIPVYTNGIEIEMIDTAIISSNSPVCEGDTLKLFSNTFKSATYSWTGPNGFTSNLQNPIIISSPAYAGTYYISIQPGSGTCAGKFAQLAANVSSITIGGQLPIILDYCYGNNAGVLKLNNYNGAILNWESTNTLGGPWNFISNTSDSLVFNNLVSTQYYRSVLKSGSCSSDTSSITKINVFQKSKGGNLTGTTNVCYGSNAGIITLVQNLGTVKKWQTKTPKMNNWVDVVNSNSNYPYTNLLDTTYFRVLVQNGMCDSAFSDTAVVYVHPLPIVNFSCDTVCLGNQNNFVNLSSINSGLISTYTWDFSDGQSSSLKSPSHLFSNYGNKNVKLVATSNFGCVDSTQKLVIINPLPNVNFSVNNVCQGSNSIFVNNSSISSGSISTYNWTFGDASTSTLNFPTHTYSNYGIYSVKLKATSNFGCSNSDSAITKVYQRANVSFSVDSVCKGLNTNFTNLSTGPNPDSVSYLWDFGNGVQFNGYSPNYIYPQVGNYSITLTATTFGQCVNTISKNTSVYPNPVSTFNFNNDCVYDSIVFNNFSTISAGTFTSTWSFGDGDSSSISSPKHLFQFPNLYNTTLSLISDKGCHNSNTQNVETYPIPSVDFQFTNACNTLPIDFVGNAFISYGSLMYNWNYGDLSTEGTTKTNSHIYNNDGNFNVKFTATSDKGCKDSISKTITVYPTPIPNFKSDSICYGNTSHITNLSSVSSGNISSYNWTFDDGTFSFLINPAKQYNTSGLHSVYLKIKSDHQCEADTTKNIFVHSMPIADFTIKNNCIGKEVQFTNTTQNDFGNLNFKWNFGDSNHSISTDESPSFIYNSFGYFPVLLTANTGYCADSVIKMAQSYQNPLVDAGYDNTVSYGFSVPLEGIAPTAISSIWEPSNTVESPNELSTFARPLENSNYKLTVTDNNGCQNFDEVNIHVLYDERLIISNIITPNGDGKNDTWIIKNANAFDVLHVNVLDEWGKSVYKSDNYKTNWNGSFNLDELPDGTYFYAISFDNNGKVYKGSITILH